LPADHSEISLVIFTCEGRDHLLYNTINSFRKACDYKFSSTILAIDGQISGEVTSHVSPDYIIQNVKRKGYVNNIVQALPLVKTDYFFWLEDDWMFPVAISVNKLLLAFQNQDVLQITLAKQPLDNDFTPYNLPGTYINGYGFSANPSLCRTAVIKEVFDEIVAYKKDEDSKFFSFESVASNYSNRKNLVSLIKYDDARPYVSHSGDLESTAREYHMINSIDAGATLVPTGYISGLQREKNITLYNKLGAFVKLYIAIIYLSIKLFFSREAYDFAFRVYLSFLKRFKH
jgi:hypothetical protein